MIEFKEVSNQYVLDTYPLAVTNPKVLKFGKCRCFLIEKDHQAVGIIIYEQKDYDELESEVSLLIFDEYRYKIMSKLFLIKLIKFTFTLGYKKVIFFTKIRSFVRVLERFVFMGVYKDYYKNKIESDKEKTWFYTFYETSYEEGLK